MGDYSKLIVGDNELLFWKWELPSDPFLEFIFHPQDQTTRAVEDVPDWWTKDYHPRELVYEVSVKEAKARLDRLGFSVQGIEDTVAGILGIEQEYADYILLTDSDFREKYAPEEWTVKSESEWEDTVQHRDRLERSAKRYHLGQLPILWKLRRTLDRYNEEETVTLDLREIIGWKERVNEFEDISVVQHEPSTSFRIEADYISAARAHLSAHQVHWVYVALGIALESAMERFFRDLIADSTDSSNLDSLVDSMYKSLSPKELLLLANSLASDLDLTEDMMNEVSSVYNERNNVLHGPQRNFEIRRAAQAIRTVERLLNKFDQLPP